MFTTSTIYKQPLNKVRLASSSHFIVDVRLYKIFHIHVAICIQTQRSVKSVLVMLKLVKIGVLAHPVERKVAIHAGLFKFAAR